jgi:hypothetical protein
MAAEIMSRGVKPGQRPGPADFGWLALPGESFGREGIADCLCRLFGRRRAHLDNAPPAFSEWRFL